MLVEEVDYVRPKPRQRFFRDLTDAFGPTVSTFRWNAVLEAKLGCDDDVLTYQFQSLAYDFFVQTWAICLGSIEEGHTTVIRCANDLDGFSALRRGTEAELSPMQPKPSADTSKPLLPNMRFCIALFSCLGICEWRTGR